VRFRAIACDYDGTLADDGRVVPETVDVLRRGRTSGRKLILITGRALYDLRTVFSELSLFDLVVAENGALLFDPVLGSEEPLCAASFLRRLRERGVPFAVGKRVVATIRPHEDRHPAARQADEPGAARCFQPRVGDGTSFRRR